jgi:hypothetical protein
VIKYKKTNLDKFWRIIMKKVDVEKKISKSLVITGIVLLVMFLMVLMNKGYIILPQIEEDKKDLTLVVSYGETQHRTIGLFSYAIGVNIQFRDAKTFELIASSEAEGIGSTEADDVRNAINKALHSIFANAEANFYTKP